EASVGDDHFSARFPHRLPPRREAVPGDYLRSKFHRLILFYHNAVRNVIPVRNRRKGGLSLFLNLVAGATRRLAVVDTAGWQPALRTFAQTLRHTAATWLISG